MRTFAGSKAQENHYITSKHIATVEAIALMVVEGILISVLVETKGLGVSSRKSADIQHSRFM